MKSLGLTGKVFLLFFALILFMACEDKEDLIEKETTGVIRDEDDAHLVAVELNDIFEKIREDLDYGYTYTNYSPNGTYAVIGSAYLGPIFSGAYTYEYIKTFTVNFNNCKYNNTTIKSGSISYSFTDYSTSGYHLIIEIKSTSGLYITTQNDDYLIDDIVTNLVMGDIDDNRYMIGGSFRSSNENTYSVKAY